MSGEGTKPPQPPEAQSLLNIDAKQRLAPRSGVWLKGDPYANLTLEAIRERE